MDFQSSEFTVLEEKLITKDKFRSEYFMEGNRIMVTGWAALHTFDGGKGKWVDCDYSKG